MTKKNYKLDKRSTVETFEQWLSECGNDLGNYDNILSCSGATDGPDIGFDSLDTEEGSIDFNKPEEIDDYLSDNDYYESGHNWWGDYKAPEKHYLDWFNEKYGEGGN